MPAAHTSPVSSRLRSVLCFFGRKVREDTLQFDLNASPNQECDHVFLF